MIEPESQALSLRLGLGNLACRSVCHGYQHGCLCAGCVKRAGMVSSAFLGWLESDVEPMPRLMVRQAPAQQPWELRYAA